MKVELFTLCDGAYNYNGKLTIVGTMDTFTVNSLPVSVGFGIAIRVLLLPEDEGSHILKVSFINPDGSNHPGELNVNFDAKSSVEPFHISLAANVNGLPFHQEGVHKVVISLDDEPVMESPLIVNIKKQ